MQVGAISLERSPSVVLKTKIGRSETMPYFGVGSLDRYGEGVDPPVGYPAWLRFLAETTRDTA